jgi:hypothetical protein
MGTILLHEDNPVALISVDGSTPSTMTTTCAVRRLGEEIGSYGGVLAELRASSFPREWIRSELINITRNHDSYYKDLDLFRVGNHFTHDMDVKRLGINPLVKRCGINPAVWFLVVLMMMSKLVLEPE